MAVQKTLVRSAPGFVASYILITTTVFVLLDVYAYEEGGLYALASFLNWGLGYVLFLGLMQNGGLTPEGTRTGIGTYFALGIAINILVALALVAFIIPGLYLLMRWLPAYSRALISYDGVGNSMRWSWAQTEPWQRPLSVGMLFPVLCLGASLAVPAIYSNFVEYVDDTEFALWSIFTNGVMSIGFVWLTVYGVAAFKLVCDQTADTGEALPASV
ncbi:hypothetical protein BG023_111679 [Porphyrobacter sp. LM 6]|nr:hypothetical protein BG023_111679 [Porphyrobacter sp. LM 6]